MEMVEITRGSSARLERTQLKLRGFRPSHPPIQGQLLQMFHHSKQNQLLKSLDVLEKALGSPASGVTGFSKVTNHPLPSKPLPCQLSLSF